jgi:hypothetical protein
MISMQKFEGFTLCVYLENIVFPLVLVPTFFSILAFPYFLVLGFICIIA